MNSVVFVICAAMWLAVPLVNQHSHAAESPQVMHTHHPTGQAAGMVATIHGYVRDVACLLRNPEAGAATTPLTEDCMRKCIRGGSPVVILTEEGQLYTPMSDVVPDTSVRPRMLAYVGKYVKAKGRVFERGGHHAIDIETIEAVSRPPDSRIPTL
jgi:hypothetical protein